MPLLRRPRVVTFTATAIAALALALGPAGAASADSAPVLSASTTSIDFGSVAIGQTSSAQHVVFTNTGTADLHLTQASWPSAPFGVPTTDCAAPLTPGASCFADITVSPTAPGSFTDTLMLNSDGGKVEIALSASAAQVPVEPHLTLTPAGHDFGSVTVGESAGPLDTLITNDGGSPITDLTIGDPTTVAFSRSTTCGAVLNPGDSCAVHISFAPTAEGGTLGGVTVTAYGNQWSIGLFGFGVAAPVVVDPPDVNPPVEDPPTADHPVAAVPAMQSRPAPSLAKTGQSSVPLALAGIALLAAGALTALLARTRMRRSR